MMGLFVFYINPLYKKTDKYVLNEIQKYYNTDFNDSAVLKFSYEMTDPHGDVIAYFVVQFNDTPKFINNFTSNSDFKDNNEKIEKFKHVQWQVGAASDSMKDASNRYKKNPDYYSGGWDLSRYSDEYVPNYGVKNAWDCGYYCAIYNNESKLLIMGRFAL